MTYFEYLKEVVRAPDDSWDYLLSELHKCVFKVEEGTETAEWDRNRIADGLALRDEYEFHGYTGAPDLIELPETDKDECTFLEFLVAFARRLENDILYVPELGERTWIWFHMMLSNMFSDTEYYGNSITLADDYTIKNCVRRVVERDYNDNGGGGNLFILRYHDCKNLELWEQAKYYIRENLLL